MRFAKLRNVNPAAISSTTASAISAATNAEAARCAPGDIVVRRSAASAARAPSRVSPIQATALNTKRGGHRRRQGEREHPRVDADGVETGNGRGSRHHRRQRRSELPGRHRSGEATGQRQHEALGENLPDQAAARRAKRQAHRKLLMTGERPRQQQIADIGAGDEQHAADASQKQQQWRLRLTNQRVAQRAHFVERALILLGVLRRHLLGKRGKLLLRAIERRPRLESPQRERPTRLAVRRRRWGKPERHDHIGLIPWWKAKSWRRHADRPCAAWPQAGWIARGPEDLNRAASATDPD